MDINQVLERTNKIDNKSVIASVLGKNLMDYNLSTYGMFEDIINTILNQDCYSKEEIADKTFTILTGNTIEEFLEDCEKEVKEQANDNDIELD